MKNSHLTEIQLQTFLIDILANNIVDFKMAYEQKSKLRPSKTPITRGSFNHTLRQARRNVTRTINTILLLGYVGILDTPKLTPFTEIANKLQEYMEAYEKMWNKTKSSNLDKNKLNTILLLKKELEDSLFYLNFNKNKE
ncbi:MAG: hypothetical protein QG670_142 [Thermoproteota archaeon]|nr:hypothetical protein [Thermoproteota archaeon]